MKKRILAILCVTSLLIGSLAGCAGNSASNGSKVQPLNYLMYYKDGKLYYDALNGSDPILLTKDSGDESWSKYLEYSATTTLTENQKRLFYLELNNEDNYFGTLYYRDVNDDGTLSDEQKVADDTFFYQVSADGNYLVYSDFESDDLYYHDVAKQESEKIGKATATFYLSKDGKKVVFSWYDSEKEQAAAYEYEQGKEAVKIGKDGAWIVGEVGDLTSYYYRGYQHLYHKEFGKEPTVIAKNVLDVGKIYDSGEIYFFRYDEEDDGFDVAEFIVDDMFDHDNQVPYAEYPKFPLESEYPNADEYHKAYQAYLDQYQMANEFQKVEVRDQIRWAIEGDPIEGINLSLHFYDGKEEHLVANYLNVPEYGMYTDAMAKFLDEPAAIFPSAMERDGKVKLSELQNTYNVAGMISEAMGRLSSYYYAKGAEVTKVDTPQFDHAYDDYTFLSGDKKSVYILHKQADYSERSYHDLYELKIEKNSLAEPEKLLEKIDEWPMATFDDGSLLCFQVIKGQIYEHDAYLDGEKIAKSTSLQWHDSKTKQFALIENIDPDERVGKLVIYDGDQKIEVDKDVYQSVRNKAGEIFYYKNLDPETYNWDLYHYKDGETTLIAKKTQYIDPEKTYDDLV